MLGADVTLVAPATLLPPTPLAAAVDDLDAVIADVDVLYLLRMQRERIADAVVPSIREYSARFGLTGERAARLPKSALVMHPGPMNRGVEILVDPAELPGAVITRQVSNGVAVRMAVLFDLLGTGAAGGRLEWVVSNDRDQRRRGRRSGRGTTRRRAHRRRSWSPRWRATSPRPADATTLDATGCVVAPGFVDLHAHLREPGGEDAETIETGSRAAALGGYTAVVAMPNTEPAADARSVVELVRDLAARAGLCDVVPGGVHHCRASRRAVGPTRRARRRRRTAVHRRRQRRAEPAADAPGDGVRARARRRARPALRGHRPDAPGR